MANKKDDFERIVKHACSGLNIPEQELKNKYKDYPVCLMEYIENGNHRYFVQVRFNDESASLIFFIGENTSCTCSFLRFDRVEEEDLFINYLMEAADFIFRKGCWIIDNCYLKVKESEHDVCFHFYAKS